MIQFTAIWKMLSNLKDSELITLWNNMCDENYGTDEERIYSIRNFNETVEDFIKEKGAFALIKRVCNGDFSPNDDWFWFDSLGNLYSTPDIYENDCPFNFKRLVNYVMDFGDGEFIDFDELKKEFLEEYDFDASDDNVKKCLEEILDDGYSLLEDKWNSIYEMMTDKLNN